MVLKYQCPQTTEANRNQESKKRTKFDNKFLSSNVTFSKETHSQTDKRQTDRQTDRHRHTYTYTDTHRLYLGWLEVAEDDAQ